MVMLPALVSAVTGAVEDVEVALEMVEFTRFRMFALTRMLPGTAFAPVSVMIEFWIVTPYRSASLLTWMTMLPVELVVELTMAGPLAGLAGSPATMLPAVMLISPVLPNMDCGKKNLDSMLEALSRVKAPGVVMLIAPAAKGLPSV